jgi:hypothetical protein
LTTFALRLFNRKFVLFNHDFELWLKSTDTSVLSGIRIWKRPIEGQKVEDSGLFLPSNRFLEKAVSRALNSAPFKQAFSKSQLKSTGFYALQIGFSGMPVEER